MVTKISDIISKRAINQLGNFKDPTHYTGRFWMLAAQTSAGGIQIYGVFTQCDGF